MLLIGAQVTHAQEPETIGAAIASNELNEPTSANNVFTREYFEQYAPVTAADMVQQLPNFTLSIEDTKRGLGQGGINILINGARLSGKNNDANSALSRISSTSVARIEILDGASLDIPGLSGTVANIITNQNTFSGSWKYRAEVQNRSRANLFGFEGSVSGTSGPFEYAIGITSAPSRDTETGPEVIVDAQGNIVETRDELALAFRDNPKISTEITFNPSNGHVGHLNANYQRSNFRFEERSIQTAQSNTGTTGQRLIANSDDSWNGEVGVDYAFDAGPGNLKLIAITRRSDSNFASNFSTYDQTGQILESIFDQDVTEGETIARAEYSVSQDNIRDWQLDVEGAFNYLESDATLRETDNTGTLVPIIFPNSSSRVEEQRVETNLTHNWKASEKLNVQASAGVEYSEISQTGPEGLTRDFVRPKGFVSATYQAESALTVRAKVERSVGQLDFETFISSVNLADDIASAGNPQIVPAQSWDAELEIEKSWNNGVSGTLKVYGQHIDDLVDRVPLPNGGDAPGNIDGADAFGVELIGTVLLDNFGLKGAKIDLELEARETSLSDPLTQVDRRFNESLVSRYQIDFRHDIPGTEWAWGAFLENYREAPGFRLNQVTHFTQSEPELRMFVEHKNVLGLTVRADVMNVYSTDYNLTRNRWTGGNRVDGNFSGFEKRVRDAAPKFGLTISGTF